PPYAPQPHPGVERHAPSLAATADTAPATGDGDPDEPDRAGTGGADAEPRACARDPRRSPDPGPSRPDPERQPGPDARGPVEGP
ncbi:hypothetical protein H8N01_01780, partial [Streptomyces sp. AC536]|nr:hypothetical protein [Streptomyces buecherae]